MQMADTNGSGKPGVTNVGGHSFQAFRAVVKSEVPYLFPVKDPANPISVAEFTGWLKEQFGPGVKVEIVSADEIDVAALPQETIDAALTRLKQGK